MNAVTDYYYIRGNTSSLHEKTTSNVEKGVRVVPESPLYRVTTKFNPPLDQVTEEFLTTEKHTELIKYQPRLVIMDLPAFKYVTEPRIDINGR